MAFFDSLMRFAGRTSDAYLGRGASLGAEGILLDGNKAINKIDKSGDFFNSLRYGLDRRFLKEKDGVLVANEELFKGMGIKPTLQENSDKAVRVKAGIKEGENSSKLIGSNQYNISNWDRARSLFYHEGTGKFATGRAAGVGIAGSYLAFSD